MDDFFAELGDGNDNVTVNDLYVFHGKTQIDGGAGNDSITKAGVFPTTQVTQSNFEWVNGRPILTTPFGTTSSLKRERSVLTDRCLTCPAVRRPRGTLCNNATAMRGQVTTSGLLNRFAQ